MLDVVIIVLIVVVGVITARILNDGSYKNK